MFVRRIAAAVCVLLTLQALADDPFRITIVDSRTGRGVPLVVLATTNGVEFITDSAGVVAFDEAGLMNTRVFFHVSSHGYEYPADGFGIRGVALDITPGGAATLEIDRKNIAERLYRITGAGIYGHSVRLGDEAPVATPLINGLVTGQDSIQSIVYQGRVHWFWGDTSRPAYPLGNFHMSGAVSPLPADGGLDPSVGIDLEYFVDEAGFSRPMIPMSKPGPVWADGFMIIPDETGPERMVCHWIRVKSLGEIYERGLAIYDDEREIFESFQNLEINEARRPSGHPVEINAGDTREYFFGAPFPALRVAARLHDVSEPSAYSGFTPLGNDLESIERGPDGEIEYAWRTGVPPLHASDLRSRSQAGELEPSEWWIDLREVETGRSIYPHGGSVAWNPFRRRWIAIVLESFGEPSFLGEIWYAEAPTPLGPWVWAQRVVTHDRYSFYNPKHHPFLDQEGGRRIYFEGTYTKMFSQTEVPTPRYDYNQIMYRLDLGDPRTHLPFPVYHRTDPDGRPRLDRQARSELVGIAFFAMAPGDELDGMAPFYQRPNGALVSNPSTPDEAPLFFAWPTDDSGVTATATALRPLYGFRNEDGAIRYSTADSLGPEWMRDDQAVALVWPNQMQDAVARAIIVNGAELGERN
ncbi:MAG: hypothetical protein ACF8PN_16285 [Phycisphaerales bacterium]